MDVNKQILEHILGYANDIQKLTSDFNADEETLNSNIAYRYSVTMCLMQIGELTTKLTEEFRERTAQIPWKEIRGFRNILAHDYGSVEQIYVWETVCDDIPVLKRFCEEQLESMGDK